MALVELVRETDGPSAWDFHLRIINDDGNAVDHLLRLSWVDYNWWSPEGQHEPSAVALAVAEVWIDAASRGSASAFPPRCDASVLRRLLSDADHRVQRRLVRGPIG